MMHHQKPPLSILFSAVCCAALIISACTQRKVETPPASGPVTSAGEATAETREVEMKKPLITHMYTADPSAHVFEGKIYIYPSHDLDDHPDRPAADDLGSQFDMVD